MRVAFLGSSALDESYLLSDSPFPKQGGKAFISYTGASVGGMVANAAIVGSALGMQASLVCEVSDFEESTQIIVDDLKKHHILTTGLRYTSKNNSRCLLIKDPCGERTVFVINDPLVSAMKLSEKQQQILLESEYIYTTIGDLQLFEDREHILHKLQRKEQGLFVDCDTHITCEQIPILKHATVVSFNEFGYHKLGVLGYSAAALIEEFGLSFVVVTKGEHGSQLYFKGGSFEQQALEVVVKDTTGAGDAFNVGFLYALLNKLKVADCLLFAAAMASLMVSQIGARIDVDEIQCLCRKYMRLSFDDR